jgi:hypothetical protein
MRTIFSLIILSIVFGFSVGALAGEQFETEKMMSQLEEKLGLSTETLKKLKPQLDAKSAELKKDVQASVDKGFVQLDELTEKLAAATKSTETKVKELLSSEEYKQFKDFMSSLDKEAIEDAKKKLSAEFSEVLQLTEEQAKKLKPVLEDSVKELSTMVDELAKSGMSALGDFKVQYEEFAKELREKLQETLDKDQLEKYDEYKEEKRDKIAEKLFEA